MGVVPITRNFLPDRQVRKIFAQKVAFRDLRVREEEATPIEDSEYSEILKSKEFNDFKNIYKQTLKNAGDKYGYRNPFMVAQEMIKNLNPKLYLKNINSKKERTQLSSVAGAFVSYPYLNKGVREKLERGESVAKYEYGKNSPWMIKGAESLLSKSFETISRNNGSLYIWTKGDFYKKGYEPLPGAGEQGLRYKLSGLERISDSLKEEHSIEDDNFKFLAMPEKLRLVKEIINTEARNKEAEIFIIEDSVENIVEAKKIAKKDEISFNSFLINKNDKTDSLFDCADRIEKEFSDKKTIFVFDMDDTLLHEEFRKENQPLQVYLRMKELDII